MDDRSAQASAMNEIRLVQAPHGHDWSDIVQFIRQNFAYMDGVINPPSSVHRLTAEMLADHSGEIWLLEHQQTLIGTTMLTPKRNQRQRRLYVGKIAIAPEYRDRGLARLLLDHAARRCVLLGLAVLELEVRIELIDNQRAFEAMGFTKIGESSHDGFDRPTSIKMQKIVQSE